MRFVLMLESQQGLSYADHVAIAKRAEANGFEALFRSDHYTSFPGPAGRPTTDAWTVLARLAPRDPPGRARAADDGCVDGARRAGSRDRPDRSRDARLAGDVPAPGQPR